jgi:hypothetical protein
LFNIPASGIVGLNLSQIATGSITASVNTGTGSFSLVSGSSTFLYVSSSGNVGIGTSTTTAKMHISGSGTQVLLRVQSPSVFNGIAQSNILHVNGYGEIGIGATPYSQVPLYVYRSTYGDLARFTGEGGTVAITGGSAIYIGSLSIAKFSTSEILLSNSAGNAVIRNSYAGPSAGMAIQAPGNIILSPGTYDGSGNLGIGLTSPTSKVHISGSSQGLFKIDSNTLPNILYVSSSGNVGIGTTSPSAKLQVVGVISNGNATNALNVSGGSTILKGNYNTNLGNSLSVFNLNDELSLSVNGLSQVYAKILKVGLGTTISSTGTGYIFDILQDNSGISFTNNAGATRPYFFNIGGSERFRISNTFNAFPNGNLLIGSTTDDTVNKLQVSGSSRFIGNMVVTGSTTITNGLVVTGSATITQNVSIAGAASIAGALASHTTYTYPSSFRVSGASIGLYMYYEGYTAASYRMPYIRSDRAIGFWNNETTMPFQFLHEDNAGTAVLTIYTGTSNNRNIIINNTSSAAPVASSLLTINSTNKGVLLPRMTEAQRLAISSPARGLLVYDIGSTTEGLWMYNSGSNPGWQGVLTNSGSQTISGSITANNITVTGTLTAQTIVAQTITSSTDYVSGSTIFGNSLSNTHQFTGSVSITGSLSVNGGSVPLGSGVAGQVTIWNGTNTISGSNDLFWDAANGRLGIGTNAPATTLDVNGIIKGLAGSSLASFTFNNGQIAYGGTNTSITGFSNQFYITNSGNNGFIALQALGGNGSLRFIGSGGGVEYARMFSSTGNWVFQNGGTFTDSGQRLQVSGSSKFVGDMAITGSGATSGTSALIVKNSAGTQLFQLRNDGFVLFGSNLRILSGNSISMAAGALSVLSGAGESLTIGMPSTNATGAETKSSVVTNTTFNPTSGVSNFTTYLLTPTINQTGGANGITRGLYVNPTLTSAADFRAIEWSNNAATAPSASWGLYGAGTAPNYLAGSLGIGSTSLAGMNLRVSKDITGNGTGRVVYLSGNYQSDVSVGYGVQTSLGTQATTFTLSDLIHFQAAQGTKGASSTIGTQIAFDAASMTNGSTNIAFRGQNASAANVFNLYMNGTAPNYLAGSLGIGTNTPLGLTHIKNGNVLTAGLSGAQLIVEGFASTIVQLASYNTGFISLSFGDQDDGNDGQIIYSNASRYMAFEVANSERFRVHSTGNVAIGLTTDTGERLQVSGSTRLAGNTFISGTLDILDAEINYQRNNNVTTGSARLIASIPTASLNAAFFDYVIVSGSNARAGTVTSVWVSSSVEWNETYTNDIGSTSDVTLYSAITGSSIGLFATSSINNVWTIKSLIRTI